MDGLYGLAVSVTLTKMHITQTPTHTYAYTGTPGYVHTFTYIHDYIHTSTQLKSQTHTGQGYLKRNYT